MEEYRAADGRHNRLVREHQRVAEVAQRVQERSEAAESRKHQAFMEKEGRIEARLQSFFRTRTHLHEEKCRRTHERLASRPATSYCHQSQLGRVSPGLFGRDAADNSRRSVRSRNQGSVSSRSERAVSLSKQQEQRRLEGFLGKLRRAEERIVCLQIAREKLRKEGRSKPVKILTGVRESEYEAARQQNEKAFILRTESHGRLLTQQRQQREAAMEERSRQESRHQEEVLTRHGQTKEEGMRRILADVSNGERRSRLLEMRRERSEKAAGLKKYAWAKADCSRSASTGR